MTPDAPGPDGFSPADVLAEVVERPREAYLPLPELERIERPGWLQLVTPSFRNGGYNEVSFSRLEPADADAAIDATIARYRELGCRFVWRVGPDAAPADLGDRLARRGLARIVVLGMARAVEPAPEPGAIEVVAVGPGELDAYTRIMAAGWDADPGPLARANALALGSPHHHLFLARRDGEPTAVAASATFPRSVYLLGGVTLPWARRRGAYRALVAARLADARARGIRLATAHAREDTAAPILGRLGFETVCRFEVFAG